MKNKIKLLVGESLRENIKDSSLLEELDRAGDSFRIISNVDSLDMVSILVDLESKIHDELGINILITSERAMSTKGPFSTVQSLTEFTHTLIEEENSD